LRPYYEDASVTLWLGKCEELLSGGVRGDVCVTDPPYGIQDEPLPGNRGLTNTWHPETDWDDAINPDWCRLACGAAPLVAWFGHWRKRDEVTIAMPHPLRAEIVWAKDTHVGFPCPLAMRDERIWLFSAVGIEGKRFETSVWDEPIIPTWAKKWHKNEKPLNLMQRLIAFLTDPGAVVLDPFAGSGTTLVAARNLGRKAIGIEQDERHCESAAQRLSQSVLELGA
jgi:DNA modification methylase